MRGTFLDHRVALGRRATAVASWQRAMFWAFALVVTARLLTLGLGLVLWHSGDIPHAGEAAGPTAVAQEAVRDSVSPWSTGVWARFDTFAYLEIAGHGYERFDEVVVFPPLYPMAIWLGGWLTGGNLLVSALLVATAATVGALFLLYKLTADLIDEDAARWATVFQIAFPTGYILIGAYAEPLMLFLAISAFYLARRERWGVAGVVAFLASLTRLQAAVLFLPLAVVAWRCRGRGWWRQSDVAWMVAAGPLGAVMYQLYLAAAGLPSVTEAYRDLWQSVVAVPGHELWLALQDLVTGPTSTQRTLRLLFFTVAVLLTVLAFRRLPIEFGVYMAALLVVSLTRHDQLGRPLLSIGRHTLMLFPGFIALAAFLHSGRSRIGVALGSAVLNLALLAVVFQGVFVE